MTMAETALAVSDDDLAGMLRAAAVDRSLEDARDFLAGLAAAPRGRDPFAALKLLAPEANENELKPLLALVEQASASAETGIVDRKAAPARLAALRAELTARGLDGVLVPMADEYQNEYVPNRARRIAWLSGFTGSAGLIVVLSEKASIFVDGRYTLQVRDQVDVGLFEPRHIADEPATDWLAENLKAGGKLGYDPWLFTAAGVERFEKAAAKAGAELVPCETNPLDAVWVDQPAPPLSPIMPHDEKFAGESAADKRKRVADELDADAAVITATDSIAWLLNIRGGDVAHTPLPLSFAILRADASVELYTDARKLTPGLERHLGNGVAAQPAESLGAGLDALKGQKVLVDTNVAAAWVVERLKRAGAEIVRGTDPVQLPKACKNEVELAGTRSAHIRDGAAVTCFLKWLEQTSPDGTVDELGAVDALYDFRAKDSLFQDLSFDTISGSGPNGAIVHYKSTPETNRKLQPGELYLVDSGAQYLDGTTDITRTVVVGTPSTEQRDRFTRVLKGHIAIATARFPAGTTGSQIDAMARAPLWQAGLDFDHGTGHGVGSYLGVHEGPQRISKIGNSVALARGMIVSNEPGYYKTGAYGIRIENLVVVKDIEIAGAERKMRGFETITKAPIDRRLVDVALLSPAELAWLNAYHAEVREVLTPLLDADTAAWLARVTAPL
ncbi:MAG: aminopeptidase P family protein [Alphaproteobacteria bacterium]